MYAQLWMISRLAQVTTYGTWDNHVIDEILKFKLNVDNVQWISGV